MTRGPHRPDDDTAQAAASLAADWLTIWQSECSAAATDPELLQSWFRLAALRASAARAAMAMWAPSHGHDDAARRTGAPSSPGAAAAAAASDARDAAYERLAGRVAELERRLAELDGRMDGPRDEPDPTAPAA